MGTWLIAAFVILAILFVIIIVGPVIMFIKRGMYKDLFFFFIALCVWRIAGGLIAILAAFCILMLAWKAYKT